MSFLTMDIKLDQYTHPILLPKDFTQVLPNGNSRKLTIERAVELVLDKNVDKVEEMLEYIENDVVPSDEYDELANQEAGVGNSQPTVTDIIDSFPLPPAHISTYHTCEDDDDAVSEHTKCSEHCISSKKLSIDLDNILINMVIDDYVDDDDFRYPGDITDVDARIKGLLGSSASDSTSLTDINPSLYWNGVSVSVKMSDNIDSKNRVAEPCPRQQLYNLELKNIRRHEKYIWNFDIGIFEKYF